MAPIVHGLEAKYTEQMNFVYLDIDDDRNDAFKRELAFRVQPHFVLLDAEGQIIKQWLGRVSPEEFETAFQEALK